MDKITAFVGQVPEKFTQKKIPKIPLIIVAVLVGSVGVYALINSFAATPKNGLLGSDLNFFPISVWLQQPDLHTSVTGTTTTRAQAYAGMGVNLFGGLANGPTSANLAALQAAGEGVAVSQQTAALSFTNYADTFKAWEQKDEPDNAQPNGSGGLGPCINPSVIVDQYNAFKAADPTRPVIIGFSQGVANPNWGGRGSTCSADRQTGTYSYPEYAKGADILSFDVYPVNDGYPLTYVADGVDNLKNWVGTAKPIWATIETTRIDTANGTPTPGQVKAEVWLALTHGATGIQYFAHIFTPSFVEAGILNDPTMYNSVKAINSEIKNLAPVLNSPTVAEGATVSSSSRIDQVVKQYNGKTYLFAVNPGNGSASAPFHVNGLNNATVTAVDESRTLSMSGGNFSDNFAGYGVHLYEITNSSTPPPATPPPVSSGAAIGFDRIAIGTNADFSNPAAQGQRYQFVIVQSWQTGVLAQLKAANPNIKVLAYYNLTGMSYPDASGKYSGCVDPTGAPEQYFLHNLSSQRFTFQNYAYIWAANQGNTAYQQACADHITADITAKGFDGAMLDDTNYSIKYHYTPSQVQEYPTDAQYGAATKSAITYVGPKITAAGKLAIPNMGGTYAEFADFNDSLLPYVSGGLDEFFTAWPGGNIQPNANRARAMQSITTAESMGKFYLANTQGANAQDTRTALYGLASVMLVSNHYTTYGFNTGNNYIADPPWLPEFDVAKNLGTPKANYYMAGSVQRRDFDSGTVLANPTSTTQTVSLGGTYSGSGLTNVTTVSMPAQTGLILQSNSMTPPDTTITSTADTTAPTVSLTAPTAGSTVSGSSVAVSANASDTVGMAGVQFKLDGNNLGSEDTTSPYSTTWDTTSATNGTHTLTAVARDAAGNTTTSSSVTVTVDNTVTSNLLWSGDFETGNLSQWSLNQSCVGPTPPAGVTVVTSPVRSGKSATAFTVSDTSTNANCPYVPTSNPRAQLVSPALFNPGDDRYISFSTYFPAGFPATTDWFQIGEIYGPPFGGSPSMGIDLTDNRLTLNRDPTHNWDNIWTASTDIAKGTGWEDLVLHVKFSTDPSVGFVELWRNGVQQTFTNGSTRIYYDTLVPGVNWDGSSPNRLVLNQYRSSKTLMGTVTLYHDEAKVGTSYASVASTSTTSTADTTAPSVSFTSPANGSTVSGIVTATAAASDDVSVAKVELSLDGSLKMTDITSPYNYSFDSKTLTNGNHTLTAKAYDAAGNSSTSTITITVNNPDITPPNAPTGLNAAASNPTTVNLTWTASTDTGANQTGVTKYNVLRNGVVIAQPTTTSYTDTNRTANTTYSYTVQAVDGAANTSNNSNTATITTPGAVDTTPPTTPTNLAATPVSIDQVNLAWNTSTDSGGSGIAGYNIYRGGTKLNSSPVTTNSYGDSTVNPNTTYSYKIEAIDGAGNKSAQTSAVNVTTPQVIRGDVTGAAGAPDGTIDLRDISYLIRNYNTTNPTADISGPSNKPDGTVDLYDLSYIIRNYGK